MLMLKSDILELDGIATNTLSERDVEIDLRSVSSVMMVLWAILKRMKKIKQSRRVKRQNRSFPCWNNN